MDASVGVELNGGGFDRERAGARDKAATQVAAALARAARAAFAACAGGRQAGTGTLEDQIACELRQDPERMERLLDENHPNTSRTRTRLRTRSLSSDALPENEVFGGGLRPPFANQWGELSC